MEWPKCCAPGARLSADILRTAVEPSWDEIGRLAAIASIRTALNYFLQREIAEDARTLRNGHDPEGMRTVLGSAVRLDAETRSPGCAPAQHIVGRL